MAARVRHARKAGIVESQIESRSYQSGDYGRLIEPALALPQSVQRDCHNQVAFNLRPIE
jgi:hypothetical protein